VTEVRRPENCPVEFDDIVEEIVACAGLPRDEVKARVWLQVMVVGGNVARDVERFDVTPHEYDANLERLSREGDGFIFETLVYWARPRRRKWIERAADRLDLHAAQRRVARQAIRILMLGDGTGSDTLYLVSRGYRIDYFDLPGSKTFAFAEKRFARAGLLGSAVRTIGDYTTIVTGTYDVVLSFEMLEHVPDARAAMSDIAAFLRPGGITLVTEAFGSLGPQYPTHLRASLRLRGKTPFLFLARGLALTWYERADRFKPMEFTKRDDGRIRRLLALFADQLVMRTWAEGRYRDWRARLIPTR